MAEMDDQQLEQMLQSGALPEEVAALIREEMQTPAAKVRGKPLPEDEALDGWQIDETDIAQAQADWVATAPDWALGLLDAQEPSKKQAPTNQPKPLRKGKGAL